MLRCFFPLVLFLVVLVIGCGGGSASSTGSTNGGDPHFLPSGVYAGRYWDQLGHYYGAATVVMDGANHATVTTDPDAGHDGLSFSASLTFTYHANNGSYSGDGFAVVDNVSYELHDILADNFNGFAPYPASPRYFLRPSLYLRFPAAFTNWNSATEVPSP
jgi:hypothetical protein